MVLSTRASLRAIRVSVLAHLRGRERGSGFLRGHLARCQRRDTGTHARHRRSPMSGRAYHPPPYSANRPHAACQSKRDRRDLSSQGPPRLRLSAGAICSCGGASGAYVFAVRCADRVSRSAQGSCYVLARSLYAQRVRAEVTLRARHLVFEIRPQVRDPLVVINELKSALRPRSTTSIVI